ncbi:SPV017 hypothetical protein [Swinepox virus]|uniref:Uncharacterized protein C15 n=2 Tax=Swinepox virus TaxID=10276 RepID=VC15_SWPVK|nr:SPV017 hypothetical protein [Swinepox virus]P32220.1 RecName: Full=Uncharacterized protein C15 [Swinepox virus (STRAIN KASZA)]AAC37856.1 ORF C15L [Swinepox virus]AAL69756.1 SPV017 hypothetical protein [Swinepox virus]UED36674.1 SPV017 hypothetical protein [Swinepox virus]UUA44207.1 SPV017 [Swinepox virus]
MNTTTSQIIIDNDMSNEVGTIMVITLCLVTIVITCYLLLQLVRWSFIVDIFRQIRTRCLQWTSRREFLQLDNMYYTNDSSVGVNTE